MRRLVPLAAGLAAGAVLADETGLNPISHNTHYLAAPRAGEEWMGWLEEAPYGYR